MSTLLKTRDAHKATPKDSPSNPMFGHGTLYDACDNLTTKNPVPMNVLAIQIDAVSHNHFKRMFPRTYAYLKQGLSDNIVFENLMIVGENTKPNTLPFLAGVMPTSIPEYQISNEDSFYTGDYQNMPLIWTDFKKLDNFITMYNEDFLINGSRCYIC